MPDSLDRTPVPDRPWTFVVLLMNRKERNSVVATLADLHPHERGQRSTVVAGLDGGKEFFEDQERDEFLAANRLPGSGIVYLLEHEPGLKEVIKANSSGSDLEKFYVSVPAAAQGDEYQDLNQVTVKVAANVVDYASAVLDDWNSFFDLSNKALALTQLSSEIYPKTSLITDLWTVNDSLGFEPFARVIADFLMHQNTKPPLTIGIRAPWGAGKTSLMRMVRNMIDPPEGSAAAGTDDARRPKIEMLLDSKPLDDRLRFGRLRRLLRLIWQGELKADIPKNRRITVWFNPWMFHDSEQVWAGLAYAIITQVTGRLNRVAAETFWFRLNVRRVGQAALRHAAYRAVFRWLLPAILVAAVLIVGAFATMLTDLPKRLTHDIFPSAGLFAGLVLCFSSYVRLHRSQLGDVLGGFVQWRDPFDSGGGDATEAPLTIADPFYETKAGFLRFVLEDVARVLELVASENRPLVIFIDDLDRCSPPVVARVIEAVNAFLAAEFRDCMFLIAMEPRAIVASIEEAYRPLLSGFGAMPGPRAPQPADEGPSPGWRFLDKLVQLPVQLPSPDSTALETYLASFGQPVPVISEGQAPESDTADEDAESGKALVRAKFEGVSSFEHIFAEVDRLHGEVPADVLVAVASEVFDARFKPADPEVMEAIAKQVRLGVINAREVKRFVNLFRFYAVISARIRLQGLPSATLAEAAKLAALATRWPDVVGVARSGQALLQLAELAPDRVAGRPRRSFDRRFSGIDAVRLEDISKYLREQGCPSPAALRLLVGGDGTEANQAPDT